MSRGATGLRPEIVERMFAKVAQAFTEDGSGAAPRSRTETAISAANT